MFVIDVLPSPGRTDYADLKPGICHIWVMANDQEIAKRKAEAYISEYGWIPGAYEHAFRIPEGTHPALHKDEERLFLQAQKFGVAADILSSSSVLAPGSYPMRRNGDPLN